MPSNPKPAPVKPCLRWAIVSRDGLIMRVFDPDETRVDAAYTHRNYPYNGDSALRVTRVRVCAAKDGR